MSRVLTWARKLRVGTPARKLVVLVLADHADTEWCTIVGQETVADETELGLRTVRRAMSELEEMGVITRQRRYRRHGHRTSDLTRLNPFWQPPDEGSPASEASNSPADPAGNPPSEDDDSPANSDRLTGHSRQPYRPQWPGIEEPPEEPPGEPPLRTVVIPLTSRGLSGRSDERSHPRRPAKRRPRSRATETDPRVAAACQLLAARDLANRRRARLTSERDLGRVERPHGWHAAATRRRLAADGPALAALAAAHPHEPPRALVDRLEPQDTLPDLGAWTSLPAAAPVVDLRPTASQRAAEAGAWEALRRAQESA